MELPPEQDKLQNTQRPVQNGGKENRARMSKIQTILLEKAGHCTPEWVMVTMTPSAKWGY